jgi:hypothetical protein
MMNLMLSFNREVDMTNIKGIRNKFKSLDREVSYFGSSAKNLLEWKKIRVLF